MTTTLTLTPTVARLAAAAVQFIQSVPLPESASIHLQPGEQQIAIQPKADRTDPTAVLGSLLLWSYRLTGITATQWHTPSGQLHITITGRTQPGISIQLYAGVPFSAVREHIQLEPGDTESVTPDELYHLALALRSSSAPVVV